MIEYHFLHKLSSKCSIARYSRSKNFSIIELNVTISSMDTCSLFDFPGTLFNLTIGKGSLPNQRSCSGKLNLVLKLSHVRMCMCLFVNSGATMTKESKLSTRLENRQRVRSRGRETR